MKNHASGFRCGMAINAGKTREETIIVTTTFKQHGRTLVLSLFTWLSIVTAGQAQPSLSWVRTGTTSWSCVGRALAVDEAGNVWTAGRFYGTADFGGTNVTAFNFSPTDAFLAKYSRDGQLLWVTRAGGGSTDEATGLAVDSDGNAYVSGFYNGTAYFDPTNITATTSHETFVAKYTPNGALLWVVRCAGNGPANWGGVAVDGAGNAYVTGSLNGAGVFGSTNVSSAGVYDAFVTKLTPEGQFLWVRTFGGRGYTYGRAIAVDPAGGISIAGAFNDTAMAGDHCLLSHGNEDLFVIRLDANGDTRWARNAGSTSNDGANSVGIDGSGNTYVGGYFNGSVTFDTGVLNSQGGNEGLMMKFDPDGRELWVRGLIGNSDDVITSLALDREGNAHVSGYFISSPLSFGGTNVSTLGGYDAFAAKFAQDGGMLWALRLGGGSHDFGHALALDLSGNVHLAGQFAYNMTVGDTNVTNPSSEGLYVARWNRDLPGFTTQPASAVVMEGTPLTLTAGVIGTGPFSYQWTGPGVTALNATNGPSLTLTGSTQQAGDYRLIVRNYEGFATSQVATVTVYTLAEGVDEAGLAWSSGGNLPWFNQTGVSFDGVDSLRSGVITNAQQSWLQTEVRGPARVSFRWRISSENGYDFLRFAINGTEVTNTSGKIEWKSVSVLLGTGLSTLRWTYTKDESESVGQDAGWVDTVSVVYAPAFEAGPISLVVTTGMTAEFSSVLGGTPPFSYQWQHDGNTLPNATNATLSLFGVGPGEAGNYVLVASNAAGAVTSAPAVLTVRVPPAITTQPTGQTVGLGSGVILRVVGSGPGPLTYQWRLNGVDIAGATQSTLSIPSLELGMAGAYTVMVSSPGGSSLSAPAVINVAGLVMRPVVYVAGVVGRSYRIEYANTLAPSTWVTLTSFALPSTPFHFVDFSAEGQPHRFYRVIAE